MASIAAALDPSSRVPLYEQVAAAVTRAIRTGELAPGSILPREPDLAEALNISRQTVNQALTGLARRGLLIRRRGVGTFVAEAVIEQPLDGLYSFIRTLIAQGQQPGTRLLGSRITVDEDASPHLTGRPDGLVFEVSRLRLVNGAPLVFEVVFLPVACGERLPLDRLAHEVLYDLLRDCCAVEIDHAEETLRPVAIARTEAALLGAAEGAAAFLVERIAFAGDRPFEFRRSLIRGDRYRFRVRLDGPALHRSAPTAARGG